MGRRPKGSQIRLKSDIIEGILDEMRIDKRELSARAKISYQYLVELMGENPRSMPSRKKVRHIAIALNRRSHEIAEGLEPSPYVSPAQDDISLVKEHIPERFMFVSRYVLATKTRNIEGMNEEPYAFRGSWLMKKGNPGDMVTIRVAGDNMEPTMYEGESVLVDQSKKEITSGKIYAFHNNNEVFVRRLRRIAGGRIEVRSDNDKIHPSYEEDFETGNLTIIGQVIWIGREMER